MLGMKESLNQLLEHFSNLNTVKSFAFELLQVKHTCRYLLFWSYTHELPKDSNHRLRITAKTKRMQIIEIDDDDLDIENHIKDLDSKYGDGTCVDSYCITITHNKWSRKFRRSPSTAPALPQPIKITIQKSGNTLIFIPDEEADWETFLSFINHLRK